MKGNNYLAYRHLLFQTLRGEVLMLLQDSLRLIDKNKKSGITKAKSKVSDALDTPVQFANKISLKKPKNSTH